MAKPPEKPIKSFSSLGEKLFADFKDSVKKGLDPCRPELVQFTPHLDIYTTSKTLFVEAEIPGVDVNDIEISLSKGHLLIKGVKNDAQVEGDDDNGAYVCMERSFGRYYRAIEIPFPINTSSIKAVYKLGILTVEAQKVTDKRAQAKIIAIESD